MGCQGARKGWERAAGHRHPTAPGKRALLPAQPSGKLLGISEAAQTDVSANIWLPASSTPSSQLPQIPACVRFPPTVSTGISKLKWLSAKLTATPPPRVYEHSCQSWERMGCGTEAS